MLAARGLSLHSCFAVDPATTPRLADSWPRLPTQWGVTTHFWIAGANPQADRATVRYYIDGEAVASIEFQPQHACGVAFDDTDNVWGNKWAGKGSNAGAFFHAFRIPFYSSLRVTYMLRPGHKPGPIYMQVRGVENLPISLEGASVPTGTGGSPKARMVLQRNNKTLSPLEYLNLVDLPAGTQGLVFQTMLSFSAASINTLGGCVHWYGTSAEKFPGVLLATGTEDFYSSSYYFDLANGATHFHLPSVGLTHLSKKTDPVEFSAYRYQDMDPLFFSDGGRMQWRNGDTVDATGLKCFTETGGRAVGSPGTAAVLTYAWVYQW